MSNHVGWAILFVFVPTKSMARYAGRPEEVPFFLGLQRRFHGPRKGAKIIKWKIMHDVRSKGNYQGAIPDEVSTCTSCCPPTTYYKGRQVRK